MSDQLREIGNKAFQDGQYAEAINAYTGAIELNPECDTSYCNRSLVYHKLGQFDEALRDAKRSIELNPGKIKGYHRYACAAESLHRYREAMWAYRQATKQRPNINERAWIEKHLKETSARMIHYFNSEPIRHPNDLLDRFAEEPDVRNRMYALARFWNLGTPIERSGIFRALLDKLQGTTPTQFDIPVDSLISLPLDNYVDLHPNPIWEEFYLSMSESDRIQFLNDVWNLCSNEEQNMIVYDFKTLFLEPSIAPRTDRDSPVDPTIRMLEDGPTDG